MRASFSLAIFCLVGCLLFVMAGRGRVVRSTSRELNALGQTKKTVLLLCSIYTRASTSTLVPMDFDFEDNDKIKTPCDCSPFCGKMLSARTQRRHRAKVQKSVGKHRLNNRCAILMKEIDSRTLH